VAEAASLRAAVDQVVPAKQHDRNLLIGTWNLRAFGDLTKAWQSSKADSPKRNYGDIHYIAAVITHFDVVAVQEVRGNIRALRYCSSCSATIGASCSPTSPRVRPETTNGSRSCSTAGG